MSYSAFESVTDAIDATRDLLLDPFSARRYLALALAAFFAGGVGGFNPTSLANGGDPRATDPRQDLPGDPVAEVASYVEAHLVELLVGGAILLAIWLAFWVVSAVMEFVLVELLRADSPGLRAAWSAHVGDGLRLVAFEALLAVLTWGSILGVGYLGLGYVYGTDLPYVAVAPSWPELVAAGVLAAAVLLVVTLVGWFTRSFVVPVMIVEGRGVLGAWSRLLSVVRREWTEYLLYALVSWVIGIAFATIVGMALALGGIGLAIPLVVVLFAAIAIGGEAALLPAIVLVVALGTLAMLVLVALINVPFASYLRYYELLVLGDTDPGLDAIPDVRASVRPVGDDGLPG